MTSHQPWTQQPVVVTNSSETTKEDLEDYITQLFGFTPKSFVSGIYNAVSEYFMEALEILKEYFEKQFSDVMTANEVAENMFVIRKHLVTHIDKAFDTLEAYLASNIFCIPSNVVLPDDRVQMDSPVALQDCQNMQADIQRMKNKILAVKLANATLKQRIQLTADLQETFDRVLHQLDEANATGRQEGVVDLRDSMSHCANRILETMRILSTATAAFDTVNGESAPQKAKIVF